MKKNKLQLKEFLSKDPKRPQMGVVCMDNEEKVAVATNAFILYASKEYYVNKGIKEPKTLCDLQGEVVKGLVYPNWKRCIPTETVPLNINKNLEQLIETAQDAAKKYGIKHVNENVNVRVSDTVWVRLGFAKIMVRAGLDGWRKPAYRLCVGLMKQWDGNTLLVMPVVGSFDLEEHSRGYFFN